MDIDKVHICDGCITSRIASGAVVGVVLLNYNTVSLNVGQSDVLVVDVGDAAARGVSVGLDADTIIRVADGGIANPDAADNTAGFDRALCNKFWDEKHMRI